MSDLNLTQLRVREDAQPQYPLLRQPSACQEWGHNEMLVLAAQGVASVTLLWRNDLIDMTDSQRQMAESTEYFCIPRGLSGLTSGNDPPCPRTAPGVVGHGSVVG